MAQSESNLSRGGSAAELVDNIESVAIVGASERAFFSRVLMNTLSRYEFSGKIYPIHPHDQVVMGHAAFASVAELPAKPSLGVLALRADRCLPEVKALGEAGCRCIVVLSDGFAETGEPEGIALQAELASYCLDRGIVLIGPNCIGFADFNHGPVALAAPLPDGIQGGRVSVVAQSGALLYSILAGLMHEQVGVDIALSIGNAAGLDVVDALELCLHRADTDIVCAYVEGFGDDIPRLERVLRLGKGMDKRIVLLKAGSSDAARRIAISHTASIVGSSSHIDALLARHDVVRVTSVEDMVRTAALSGCLNGRTGIFALTSTGGGASITGDLAAEHGVLLPELSAETLQRLAGLLPKSAFIGNPMDMSGQVAGGKVSVAEIYDVLFVEPGIDAVLFVAPVGFPDDSPDRAAHRLQLEDIATSTEQHGLPLIIAAVAQQPWTDWMIAFLQRHPSAIALSGISATMAAMGRLRPPASPAESMVETSARSAPSPVAMLTEVLDEAAGRQILEQVGFPVVPGAVCTDQDDIRATADRVGYPLVVKGILPGVSHKAALGAVVLSLCDAAAVEEACLAMRARVGALSEPRLEGLLMERMISGTEFLVGLTRDKVFGDAITFGLGGVLAETTGLNATALVSLYEPGLFERLFHDAGLHRLLATFAPSTRERIRANLELLCREFTEGALRSFGTVEINPLFVTRAGDVLAGDVLLVRAAS